LAKTALLSSISSELDTARGSGSYSRLPALPATFWIRPQSAGQAKPTSAYAGMVPQAAVPAAGAEAGATSQATAIGNAQTGSESAASPATATPDGQSSGRVGAVAKVSVSLASPSPSNAGSPVNGQKPSAPSDPQSGRPAFAAIVPKPWRDEDEEEAE